MLFTWDLSHSRYQIRIGSQLMHPMFNGSVTGFWHLLHFCERRMGFFSLHRKRDHFKSDLWWWWCNSLFRTTKFCFWFFGILVRRVGMNETSVNVQIWKLHAVSTGGWIEWTALWSYKWKWIDGPAVNYPEFYRSDHTELLQFVSQQSDLWVACSSTIT